MTNLLADLATALGSGTVRVIDLSQPLAPDTPVIALPPQFGQSAPFRVEPISHYDARGPAWAWSNLSLGEHTGTHFDAPIHWITGKDQPNNALDTIPPQRLVAPANVIDCATDCATNPDFLLTRARLEAWEAAHGRIEAGSWVLLRSDWSKRPGPAMFLNAADDGPHTPGPDPDCVQFMVRERDVIGFGTETVGTDAGQAFGFDPPFPCHAGMHGANKFGLASLTNLDRLPPKGAILITPPAEDRRGHRKPMPRAALVAG